MIFFERNNDDGDSQLILPLLDENFHFKLLLKSGTQYDKILLLKQKIHLNYAQNYDFNYDFYL